MARSGGTRSTHFTRLTRRTAISTSTPLTGRCGGLIIESLSLHTRDSPASKAFQGTQGIVVLLGDKADRLAHSLGTTSATNAMDIILMVRREVIVHDMSDPVDVDAARGYIRGHKNTDLSIAEFIKGTEALVLGTVGMDGSRRDTGLLEAPSNAVGSMLGAGENEHHVESPVLKQMEKETRLEMLGDLINRLGDGVGGIGTAADLNRLGLLQELTGEFFDLAGERGGEEEGLTLARQELHDLSDRGDKSHVEHPVGLVEHKELDVGKGFFPATDQVEKASRRSHNEIGSLLERLDLGTLADPPVDRGHRERHMLGVGSDILLDLDDQFAGRSDDEGADTLGGRTGQQ